MCCSTRPARTWSKPLPYRCSHCNCHTGVVIVTAIITTTVNTICNAIRNAIRNAIYYCNAICTAIYYCNAIKRHLF
jgi:hypothetical protein|eukprot:COSAG01_NODE_737_length_13945_cov_10.858082_4_plen_76_part_00